MTLNSCARRRGQLAHHDAPLAPFFTEQLARSDRLSFALSSAVI